MNHVFQSGNEKLTVFPTGVGMNRLFTPKAESQASVPHRRGDEPMSYADKGALLECSPQAWG